MALTMTGPRRCLRLLALAATWDKALVRQAGEIVGREAKALGYTNVYAPILDPARDQRWGRVVECYGEDPFILPNWVSKWLWAYRKKAWHQP